MGLVHVVALSRLAREAQYARRWDTELSEHVSEVPHFEKTFRDLRRALRDRY